MKTKTLNPELSVMEYVNDLWQDTIFQLSGEEKFLSFYNAHDDYDFCVTGFEDTVYNKYLGLI